jgi:integrase
MTRVEQGPHAYRPRIDPDYWEVIRDFVRDVVQRADGKVAYDIKTLYWAISDFALWAWQDAGLPLDAEELFDRDVVAYYTQVGCGKLTAAARGNRRSLLLRVVEVLDALGPAKLPPLPPSDPSEPYRRRDVVSMISWARAQSTHERRVSAHVLIALGFGAGLSAQEIIGLRNRDVARSGNEVTVHVRDGRKRAVPMLSEFAELMPHADPAATEAFAFRPGRAQTYVNAISNFVRRGYQGGARPQAQRMRATWIVHHLDSGTPIPVLVAAAGLESFDALARFERFARPIPPELATRYLRYAEPGH